MMMMKSQLRLLLALLMAFLLAFAMPVSGEEAEQQQHIQQQQQQQQCEPCHCPTDELERLKQDHHHVSELHRQVSEQNVEHATALESCRSETQSLQDSLKAARATAEEQLTKERQQKDQMRGQFREDYAKATADKQKAEEEVASAQRTTQQVQRQLKEVTRKIQELEAKKSIVTIDWDLLQERWQEIQATLAEHWNFVKEHVQTAFDKCMTLVKEAWHHFQTVIVPRIQHWFHNDVVPFVQTVVTRASEMWEEIYGPYRKPVNAKVAKARAVMDEKYQEHIHPLVKEYKVDEKLTVVKEKFLDTKYRAELLARQGHESLVQSLKFHSRIALDFVKMQEGPKSVADAVRTVYKDPETAATRIEYVVGALVLYILYKLFFGKKKKSKKSTKKAKANANDKNVTFKGTSPNNKQGEKKKKKLY